MSNPVERFKVIPAVFAIFRKTDGTILLSRRINTGHADGQWSLPAGHVEEGESIQSGLIREVREEVGVIVEPEDLTLIVTESRQAIDGHRVDFFFMIDKWQGQIENLEPEKCETLEWFHPEDLPKNTVYYVRDAINAWLDGRSYIENDWNR